LKDDGLLIRAKEILIALFFCFIFCAGCVQISSSATELTDIEPEPSPITPYQSEDEQTFMDSATELPLVLTPPTVTPSPVPTPLRSNVSDWNPYSVLPTQTPILNHFSILKNDTPNYRKVLNTTYSGSVGLAGNAIGKDLNITTGPFAITYTVHPNVSSPLDVWVKLTVFDPWQNVIAVGGYNRGYPNEETQTITLYHEGRYYLSIEGDFASVDYSIKTGDQSPVSTQNQIPVSSEEIFEEEMMQY